MKHHYYFCKKVAFTLAEVLITLGVIGVVAALTMPSLMANHKDKVLAVRAKKSYSTISQAVKLWEAKTESVGDITMLFDPRKSADELTRDFAQLFDSAKLCMNANDSGCTDFYHVKYNRALYDKNEDGSYTAGKTAINIPYFITKDGTVIKVTPKGDSGTGSCTYSVELPNINTPDGRPELDDDGNEKIYSGIYHVCAHIVFDTDGQSGINQFGADAFELRIHPDGSFEGWKETGWDSLRNIIISGKPVYSKYNIGSKFED